MSQHDFIQRQRSDTRDSSPAPTRADSALSPASSAAPAFSYDFTQIPAYAPDSNADMSVDPEQEAERQAAQQQCTVADQQATSGIAELGQQTDALLGDELLPPSQKVALVNEAVSTTTTQLDRVQSDLASWAGNPIAVEVGIPSVQASIAARLKTTVTEVTSRTAQTVAQDTLTNATRAIADMEQQVAVVLDDSELPVAKKVALVNEATKALIAQVKAIQDELAICSGGLDEEAAAIEGARTEITSRRDAAIAHTSANLQADPAVAQRIEQMRQTIAEETGNITINTPDEAFMRSPEPDEFWQNKFADLDTLMSRPAGLELVMGLMDGKHQVRINADSGRFPLAYPVNVDDPSGTDTDIYMSPDMDDDDMVVLDDTDQELPCPSSIMLGHELIHAAHNADGKNLLHAPPTNTDGAQWTTREEQETVASGHITENDLRDQLGVGSPRYKTLGRSKGGASTP